MTEKFQQFKQYIKSLELDSSDLFLAIGFLFSVPFYAFAWKFMVTADPSEILLKNWMIIVCFSVTAICWGIYFYKEIKRGRLKNNAFLWVYVFLTILGLVGVLVQPKVISNMVEVKAVPNDIALAWYPGISKGDLVEVTYTISTTHRLFFACATLCIHTIYFIILTLLPKRVKDMYFIVFCALFLFTFIIFITFYSYIVEGSHYIPFIKAFFSGDMDGVYANTVMSVLTHRVPYGVTLMLGLMFGLLLHSITKKWYWFIPVVYCYINLIFTWCKTSLALSALAIALYLVFLLIESFKNHKKRNTILACIYGGVVFLGLLVVLVSVITKGKFVPIAFKLFSSFTDGRTIETRTFIWGNIRLLLSNGWIFLGRGFGTYNSMLFPMNILNGDFVCPSHSSYYAVLGQGGIFTLIGFLASIIYYGFIFVKSWKINKMNTVKYALPVFIYFLYTFTEGINYILVVFMFPLILYYYLNKRGLINDAK